MRSKAITKGIVESIRQYLADISDDVWVSLNFFPLMVVCELAGLVKSQFSIVQRGLSRKSLAIVNTMRGLCTTSMYPGSQGEWTGMCVCEQGHRHCTSQWGTMVDAIE